MIQRRELIESWRDWRILSGAHWTDWLPLSPATIAIAPTTPGAYVLGLPPGPPMGRLLAEDPHRLLDIGESGNLKQRLASLRACASTPGRPGHMAGWRLGSLGLLEKLGATVDGLQVSWRSTETKEGAYAAEGLMLRLYFDIFGELAPLNYKFNWSGLVEIPSE